MKENTMQIIIAIVFAVITWTAPLSVHCGELSKNDLKFEDWGIGPFEKDIANPILIGNNASEFMCPVTGKLEHWESGGVLNPTAVVKDGKVYLIYRALSPETTENNKDIVTSRLGLATSEDGFHFTRDPDGEPILYPTTESQEEIEWYAGCQDPRVVKREDGTYVMIYVGNDGSDFVLKVATSLDLKNWTKKGFAFEGTEFREYESRSVSIVTKFYEGEFIAATINDYYWMYFWYWGDYAVYCAKSTDLITWSPMTDASGNLLKVFGPRDGYFDRGHVEPGPQAILRIDGILLMYNSKNVTPNGLPDGSFSAGQAIFAPNDPTQLIGRSELPFLIADKEYETSADGMEKLIFPTGLICFQGKWILYYGAGDHKIAVATSQDDYCKEDVDYTISTTDIPSTTPIPTSSTTPSGVSRLQNFNVANKFGVIFTLFYCIQL